MPYSDRTLDKWIMLAVLVLPTVLYFGTAALYNGRVAIEFGNAVLLALAAGVAFVYAPIFWMAVTGPRNVPWQFVLGSGIFLGFTGVFAARLTSIVWRALGQPQDWLDSTLWGAHIALTTAAALGHMLAPKSIHGVVPTFQWLKLGMLVAAGILVFSLIVWWL